jgi:hypothetical protein
MGPSNGGRPPRCGGAHHPQVSNAMEWLDDLHAIKSKVLTQ